MIPVTAATAVANAKGAAVTVAVVTVAVVTVTVAP